MHDELCRKCGGMLTNWSLCSECRKPVKRICIQCGSHTVEVIHNLCFYHIAPIQTETSLGFDLGGVENNGVILQVKNRGTNQLLSEIIT